MTDHRFDDRSDFGDQRLAEDMALLEKLQDVVVPEGLESRLLAAISAETTAVAPADDGNVKGSRRAWMSSAAGLGGLAVSGGLFHLYTRRKLHIHEARDSVNAALLAKKWVVPWQEMKDAPDLPFPKGLRIPRGWQYVDTSIAGETAAFDLTLPGGRPAVLFAARIRRDISGFPSGLPITPGISQSGPWERMAIWRSSGVLYVLASQGTDHDYQQLFSGNGTSPLA